jgi:hypothetical protein
MTEHVSDWLVNGIGLPGDKVRLIRPDGETVELPLSVMPALVEVGSSLVMIIRKQG